MPRQAHPALLCVATDSDHLDRELNALPCKPREQTSSAGFVLVSRLHAPVFGTLRVGEAIGFRQIEPKTGISGVCNRELLQGSNGGVEPVGALQQPPMYRQQYALVMRPCRELPSAAAGHAENACHL